MKDQTNHNQLIQVEIESLANEQLWDSRELGATQEYARPVPDSTVVKIKRLIESAKVRQN